jgi:hypothetical protein
VLQAVRPTDTTKILNTEMIFFMIYSLSVQE